MAGTLAAREHAWGPAGEEVAVCGGGAEVRLLRPGAAAAAAGAGAGAGAAAAHPPRALLRGHEGPVAAVDWSPEAGLLLTGGHDRNVYVWRRAPAAEEGAWAGGGDGGWQREMVLLPAALDRAVLAARWAPGGRKFACGGGARVVSVSYYEAEDSWWTSKLVRKRQGSSVTSLAWHPSGALLATGCADGHCRVLAAVVPRVDAPKESVPRAGRDSKFGTVLVDASGGGWVHGVAWSPSGSRLAFASHDSTVTVLTGLDATAEPDALWAGGESARVKLRGRPVRCLLFLAEDRLVGGGWEPAPVLMASKREGATPGAEDWGVLLESLEGSSTAGSSEAGDAGGTPGPGTPGRGTPGRSQNTQFASAFAKFEQFAPKAKAVRAKQVGGPHKGCITCLRVVRADPDGTVEAFSSSGMDGRLITWGTADIERQVLAQLSL